MKRRVAEAAATTWPPTLAVFNSEDWPTPTVGDHWPRELPVIGFRRLAWQRARRAWERATAFDS